MKIVIKSQPQIAKQVQQVRTKQSPEIARDIVKTLNVTDKSDIKAISVVKGIFNGVNNDIPVNFAYVDSNGDMVKISHLSNGCKIVEIEPCEATLEYEAKLYENVGSDDEKTSTGITRTRIKIEGNEIDVCKVTLGLYRNYILNKANFDALKVKGIRITYEKDGKTIYETIVKCLPEHKVAVIKLIKDLKKEVIEWL
jgi:hypothetical protein